LELSPEADIVASAERKFHSNLGLMLARKVSTETKKYILSLALALAFE
jgi:hypothetical protein